VRWRWSVVESCHVGNGLKPQAFQEPWKWSFPMHKWIAGLVALTVMSVVTLPAAGQTTCPEGQHYDAEKKMCVPLGK
jgi:hypothetical protein